MTITELEENLRNLKDKDTYCNLFKEYHSSAKNIREIGLFVAKNNGIWEASYVVERGSEELACVFYEECNLYEFVYCYFKKVSDVDYWLSDRSEQYFQKLIKRIKKFKISESEYSFDGGMSKDCLCVEQKEDAWEVYYSNGIEKVSRGIFYRKNAAYDFLFYLVMKKHVSMKKHWW